VLAIRSGFADIFEVRAKNIVTRGNTETVWKDGVLTTKYRSSSCVRGIVVGRVVSTSEASYANSRLMFNVVITPGKI
jgi:hypothetical protein